MNMNIQKSIAAAALGAALLLASAGSAFADTVVYNAIPSTLAPNYPSQPFQAQQTNEFGDYVHLGGSARQLTTVTVTMDNWALQATPANVTFCAANASNCDSTGFNWPITVNIYSSHLGSNGAPDTLLATKTVTQHIPWRPAANATCADASQWKAGDGNCYSGIAANVTFDLSNLNVTLPNDVIVGFVYNTQTYGPAPTGIDGPYNSLNIAVPTNDPVTVGTDDNVNNVFWNTSTASWYADHGAAGVGIFRQDTNWAPYGTVAFQIDATSPAPTTKPATAITSSDATLNGTNGPAAASQESFWVSKNTPIDTSSPNIPVGVYSTPVLPGIAAGASFSDPLSLVTTNGIVTGGVPGNMPAITPNTTYYFVAWANIGGTWYPGQQLSVTTSALAPSVTTKPATAVAATSATVNGTNGPVNADNTSFWWGTTPIGPLTASANPSTEFPATGWSHDSGLGSAASGAAFSGALTGLSAGTNYSFVAWVEVGGTWYPGTVLSFTTATPPANVTVTIDKFIDGAMATAASANSSSFPMTATWNAANIGAGTGSYTLSTTGYNSPNAYEAVTSSMSSGASYSTSEVTGGTVVGASCASGAPYALSGYTTGTSLAAAKAATPTLTVPSFSNITQNEYVIVWNKECLAAPTLLTPPSGTVTTTAGLTGASWSAVTDPAGGISYIYQSSNSSAQNADGSFTTPAFTSGSLTATSIPTPGTPAGNYWWHVMAKDTDGNMSPWSSVWTFTVNNTPAPSPSACATPTVVPQGYALKNAPAGNLSFVLAPYTMFVGKAGNYNVSGPSGNYIICLGNGNGTVNLGNGSDTITTGNGDQKITVGAGNSAITTGNGNSQITAGTGTDTITTGNGNQTISAGGGASVCHVGKGVSTISGCTH